MAYGLVQAMKRADEIEVERVGRKLSTSHLFDLLSFACLCYISVPY